MIMKDPRAKSNLYVETSLTDEPNFMALALTASEQAQPLIRKSATKLITNEPDLLKRYVDACVQLKKKFRLGSSYSVYDEFVGIHLGVIGLATTPDFLRNSVIGAQADFSGITTGWPAGPAAGVNGAHDGDAFLPWHREYLYRFEDELRMIDADVTIPYWDWTDHKGTSQLFTDEFLGPNGTLSGNQFPILGGKLVGSNFPVRPELHYERFDTFPQPNYGATLQRMITTNAAGKLDVGSLAKGADIPDANKFPDYTVFRDTLENTGPLHGFVHGWIGRSMVLWTSCNDPVFWMHHANIDRIWSVWQAEKRAQWEQDNPGQEYSYETHYVPSANAGYGHKLMDRMWPWDGGQSQPARYIPGQGIGITGQNIDPPTRREINKYAFAGRALPQDIAVPDFGEIRLVTDVLDLARMGLNYEDP